MAKRGIVVIAAISMFIVACPWGHAASQESPTPQEIACAAARADKMCGAEAVKCHYKFTVKKVVDPKQLEVTYPKSVWSVTKHDMKDKEEEEYEESQRDKKFPIHLKSGTATKGDTYIFTRCPDGEFTLGEKIDPNDTHEDRQPKPKP